MRVFNNFDTMFGKFLSLNCSIAVLKPAGCIFQRFTGRESFRLLTCFIVSTQVKSIPLIWHYVLVSLLVSLDMERVNALHDLE